MLTTARALAALLALSALLPPGVRAEDEHQRLFAQLQAHDPGTARHSLRTAALTAELYEVWAVDAGVAPERLRSEKQQLFQGALLHDLGKVATSRRVLNSRLKGLPEHMFQEIKKHPADGRRALGPELSQFAPRTGEMAQYHHEKWNGTGYHGVKGEAIPFAARAAAICDVFEAVTGDRPYRQPMSEARALGLIKAGAGTDFDPALARLFVERFDTIKAAARLDRVEHLRPAEHVRLKAELGRTCATTLAGVASQLLTLVVMQVSNQLLLDGKSDAGVVLQSLDSPDTAMVLGLTALPVASTSFFAPLVRTVAGLVTFQVAGTLGAEALEGLGAGSERPSFSQVLTDDALRARYVRNLIHLVQDPDRRRSLITTVFRDRIASLEFAATLAGMYAGSTAGVRLGAATGTGPVGSTLLSALGAGLGAAIATNSCKALVSAYEEQQLSRTRARLRSLLAVEETHDLERDLNAANRLLECMHAYELQRNAVVEKRYALYASSLAKELLAEQQARPVGHQATMIHAETAARSKCATHRQAKEAQQAKLTSLFSDELDMYAELIDREPAGSARRDCLVGFENETFLASSQLQASLLALRDSLGDPICPTLWAAEPPPAAPAEALAFDGLASR